MIQGVVFDFDGLILETETPEYLAWKEVFAQLGVSLPLSVWRAFVGSTAEEFDPMDYLEEQLGHTVDRSRLLREIRIRSDRIIDCQGPMPGASDYLKDARRLKLQVGLASSSDSKWVMSHLGRLELSDYFDVIRCREHVARPKPAPDLYLSVLEAFRLPPENCLAFEDSQNGVQAAKSAGLHCVAVPNEVTRGMDFSMADMMLSSLQEVPLAELIHRLE